MHKKKQKKDGLFGLVLEAALYKKIKFCAFAVNHNRFAGKISKLEGCSPPSPCLPDPYANVIQ